MNTTLDAYTIWHDGDISIKVEEVEKYLPIVPTGRLCVDRITPELTSYNKMMDRKDQVRVKTEIQPLDLNWNLPDSYKDLDVYAFIMNKFDQHSIEEDLSDKMMIKGIKRIQMEYSAFERNGLINLLRCLIYVVDTFINTNTVWGVGRGSCVSSYILYLLQVHDINSMKYDLPFSDFIKT